MRARLFEAEIDFPPFDFLKGDDIGLFDFVKLNACYLDKR
jgi:hypothetical protein